ERNPDDRMPRPEAPHDELGSRLQRRVKAMVRVEGVENVLVIAVESGQRAHQAADVAAVARAVLLRRVRVNADLHRYASATALLPADVCGMCGRSPSGVMGRLPRRGSHPGASFARASEGGTRKEKYHQHQLDLHA